MTQLRITDRLIADTNDDINRLEIDARSACGHNYIKEGTIERAMILEIIQTWAYCDAPHLQGALPEPWLNNIGTIFVKVTDRPESTHSNNIRDNLVEHTRPNIMDGSKGSYVAETLLRPTDEEGFVLPHHIRTNQGDLTFEMTEDDCTGALGSWLQREKDRIAQLGAIADKYEKVRYQIEYFLRAHTTLNAAVDEVPEVKLYVPRRYIDEMKALGPTKQKRKKPSVAEALGVDREFLASAANQ